MGAVRCETGLDFSSGCGMWMLFCALNAVLEGLFVDSSLQPLGLVSGVMWCHHVPVLLVVVVGYLLWLQWALK